MPLRFCGFYDITRAQDFAADNIGINAIIEKSAAETNFVFDVAFRSTALPHDGIGFDATLTATFPTNDTKVAVFYTPSLPG